MNLIARNKIPPIKIEAIILDCDYSFSNPNVESFRISSEDLMAIAYLQHKKISFCSISNLNSNPLQTELIKIGAIENYKLTSNKLNFVEAWLSNKNLNFRNILYFGVNHSSIPPMRISGISVTSDNADSEIKEYSDYIVDKNCGFGGIEAIRKLVLPINQKGPLKPSFNLE